MAVRARIYVDGVNLSTIKKIAIYDFGEDNILGVKNDAKRYEFTIIVSENVEDEQIYKFQQYWGRGGGLRIVRGVE